MRKPVFVSLISLLLLLALSSMALATSYKDTPSPDGTVQPMISAISNEFTASNQNPASGEVVSFQSETTFDWQYLPNPYPSNFLTAIPYDMFRKPKVTAWALRENMTPSFTYVSGDAYIGYYPSWRYHPGDSFYFLNLETWWVQFEAETYSKYPSICYDRQAYHGQTDNSWDSRGIPVKLKFKVCP